MLLPLPSRHTGDNPTFGSLGNPNMRPPHRTRLTLLSQLQSDTESTSSRTTGIQACIQATRQSLNRIVIDNCWVLGGMGLMASPRITSLSSQYSHVCPRCHYSKPYAGEAGAPSAPPTVYPIPSTSGTGHCAHRSPSTIQRDCVHHGLYVL